MSTQQAAPGQQSAGTATDQGPAARYSGAWFRDQLIRHAMVVVMLLIIAYFSYRSARFGTLDNIQTIGIAAAPFALIALGQTLVILTGGIDLSVGSIIALSAMSSAATVKGHPERLWLAVLVALFVGLAAGAVNGFLVAKVNVPPFIATLGMLTTASGLAYVVGSGAPINGLPGDFGKIANNQVFGLQIPVIVMIVGILALALIMARTSYGMRIYAVGGNPVAAQIAGVKTGRILFSVYAISGVLAGLSGVMLASRVISGPPNLGQGYELDAIAAVVIGGASLSGGKGKALGTFVGALILAVLRNGLNLLSVSAFWQQVVIGVVIALAVLLDTLRRRQAR
jgi:ribose transport system permease protein